MGPTSPKAVQAPVSLCKTTHPGFGHFVEGQEFEGFPQGQGQQQGGPY